MRFYIRQLRFIFFLLLLTPASSYAQSFPDNDQVLEDVALLMNKGMSDQAEDKIKAHTLDILERGSIEEYYKSLTMLYRVLRAVEESNGEISAWYYLSDIKSKTDGIKALFTDFFRLRALREYYLNISGTAASWILPQTDWDEERLQEELLVLQKELDWKTIEEVPTKSLKAIFTATEETVPIKENVQDFFVAELLDTWMLLIASENSTLQGREYEKLNLSVPYLESLFVPKKDPIQHYLPLHMERRALLIEAGRIEALAYHDFLLIKHLKYYLSDLDYYVSLKTMSEDMDGLVADMIRLEMAEHLFYNMAYSYNGTGRSSFSLVIDLVDTLKSNYPRKHFLHNNSILLERKIKATSFDLDLNPVNTSGERLFLNVEHKNVDSIYLRLCKVPHDLKTVFFNMEKSRNKRNLIDFSENFLLEERTELLTPSFDYLEKRTSIPFGPLPEGTYFFLASNDEDFQNGNLFVEPFDVMDAQLFSMENEEGQTSFLIRSKKDFKPEINYGLKMFSDNGESLALIADSTEAYFQLLEGQDEPSSCRLFNDQVDFEMKKNPLFLNPVGEPLDTFHLMFFPNKPVYQKGDSLFFKLLLKTNDYFPAHLTANLEFPVYLMNGTEDVDSLIVQTDDNGAANGSFLIPDFADEDWYLYTTEPVWSELKIQIDEINIPNYNLAISVEEFKVDSVIQLAFDIDGKYGTGEVVQGKLKYLITLKDGHKDLGQIQGLGRFAENGRFSFKDNFAIQDSKVDGFIIDVEAIDTRGERQSRVYNNYDGGLFISDMDAIPKPSVRVDSEHVFKGETAFVRLDCPEEVVENKADYNLELWYAGPKKFKNNSPSDFNNAPYAYSEDNISSKKDWDKTAAKLIFERSVLFDSNNSDSLDLNDLDLSPGYYKALIKAKGLVIDETGLQIFENGQNPDIEEGLFIKSSKDEYVLGDSIQVYIAHSFSDREVYYRLVSTRFVIDSGFAPISKLINKKWHWDESIEEDLKFELITMDEGKVIEKEISFWCGLRERPSLELELSHEVTAGEMIPLRVEWKGKDPEAFFYSVYPSFLDNYERMNWKNLSYSPYHFSRVGTLREIPSHLFRLLPGDVESSARNPIDFNRPMVPKFKRLKEYGFAFNDHQFPVKNGFKPYFLLKGDELNLSYNDYGTDSTYVSPFGSISFSEGNAFQNDFSYVPDQYRRTVQSIFVPLTEFDERGVKETSFRAPEAVGDWKLIICGYDAQGNIDCKEKEFTVSKPFNLIPDYPAVLRGGDEIDISVRIFSSSMVNSSIDLELEIDSAHKLQMENEPLQRVKLEDGFALVSWRVKLDDLPVNQDLQFLIKATSGDKEDMAEGCIQLLPAVEYERTSTSLWLDKKEKYFIENSQEQGVDQIDIVLLDQYFHLFMDELGDILLKNGSTNERIAIQLLARKLYSKVSLSYPDFRSRYSLYIKELERQLSVRGESGDLPVGSNELAKRLQLHKAIFNGENDEAVFKLVQELKKVICYGEGFAWYGKEQPDLEISILIFTLLQRIETENIFLHEARNEDFGLSEFVVELFDDSSSILMDVKTSTKIALLNLLMGSALEREYHFDIRALWVELSSDWESFSATDQLDLAMAALKGGNMSFAREVMDLLMEGEEYDENGLIYWTGLNTKDELSNELDFLFKMHHFMELMNVQASSKDAVKRRVIHTVNGLTNSSDVQKIDYLHFLSRQLIDQDVESELIVRGKNGNSNIKGLKEAITSEVPICRIKTESGINGTPTTGFELQNRSKTSVPVGLRHWSNFKWTGEGERQRPDLNIEREWYIFNEKDSLVQYLPEVHSLSKGDLLILRVVLYNDRDMRCLELKDEIASGLFPSEYEKDFYDFSDFSARVNVNAGQICFLIDKLPKGKHILEIPYYFRFDGKYFGGYSSIRSVFNPSVYARTAEQSFGD